MSIVIESMTFCDLEEGGQGMVVLLTSWSVTVSRVVQYGVVNGVLLPSIALNCLPGCCIRMFNCSGILD
jgi:hypothetical protein